MIFPSHDDSIILRDENIQIYDGTKNENHRIIFISCHRDEKSKDFSFCGVAPPRIARGPAAYETAEVLFLQGAMIWFFFNHTNFYHKKIQKARNLPLQQIQCPGGFVFQLRIKAHSFFAYHKRHIVNAHHVQTVKRTQAAQGHIAHAFDKTF